MFMAFRINPADAVQPGQAALSSGILGTGFCNHILSLMPGYPAGICGQRLAVSKAK